MDTHSDSLPTGDRGGDRGPTPEEARRMLADAARIGHRTPDAVPPVLISFAILCAIGTMATLGVHLAARVLPDSSFDAPLAVTVMAMAWVFVAIIVPFLFRRPLRRGLAVRWYIYMGSWGVLWAASMLLGETFAALVLAPLFLGLFMIAAATEAKRARTARAEEEAAQSAVVDGDAP
ncbi:MAG: hypothetical protein ACTHVY_04985 [Brevibacterium yomogidense]|uniref:Uncharacterized protein n=1 Tax=Brevibacterium yomogidense TaxID=946573 RepID=A0A1X6XHJ0_9MICO|nr:MULTISPECIES: hypothetical protein [Brevibacterium]SLM98616.1 hypothetical protein FM105_09175 [Brevibacterium yomogidense]SMX64177.1 hypothetical protein BSP109_00032 [Brevibacterium sp. Mu109]